LETADQTPEYAESHRSAGIALRGFLTLTNGRKLAERIDYGYDQRTQADAAKGVR
jgi:hypothetical protein